MSKPIGASITYIYSSNPSEEYEGYVSFGEYIESANADSYGVDDDAIFYYAQSVEELQGMVGKEWQGGTITITSIDGYTLDNILLSSDNEEDK